MKKLATLILALAALAFNPLEAADGGVAVADLNMVAKELGVLDFIAVTLENKRVELAGQLQETQQKLQGQMNNAMQKAGDNPSREDQQKIITIQRELETQFQQENARLSNTLKAEELRLINEFREELKPHALALAKEKGLSVILSKGSTFLYAYEDSVDITVPLTAKAKQAGMTKKAPPRTAPKGKGKAKGKGK